MANEHTYSDAADLRTTNILNREIWELLADMTDLRSVCRWVHENIPFCRGRSGCRQCGEK